MERREQRTQDQFGPSDSEEAYKAVGAEPIIEKWLAVGKEEVVKGKTVLKSISDFFNPPQKVNMPPLTEEQRREEEMNGRHVLESSHS
uniref:GYF_2 domain-containing protein n=1 Tax=Rhabditophanes sp. KR3021 TaxID=114890 RepID=A0AC35TWU2_9BILA